jgi:hypothetical protein
MVRGRRNKATDSLASDGASESNGRELPEPPDSPSKAVGGLVAVGASTHRSKHWAQNLADRPTVPERDAGTASKVQPLCVLGSRNSEALINKDPLSVEALGRNEIEMRSEHPNSTSVEGWPAH